MADRKKNRGSKRKSTKTRKPLLQAEEIGQVDLRNIETLKKFTTELGKIMPRRLTGVPPKMQRELARAIKRARVMGLVR